MFSGAHPNKFTVTMVISDYEQLNLWQPPH